MHSNCQLELRSRPGSASWVRARLMTLPLADGWTNHPACTELIEWLYTVVRHRASALPEPPHARADIAQDAMTTVFQALQRSRPRLVRQDNPAAVLERVAERAIDAACHIQRMSGFGGVAPNGRNWHKPYPARVGDHGDIESLMVADSPCSASRHTDRTVSRIVTWAFDRLGIAVTTAAVDATTYVIDRMLSGLSRSSLTRGGHSGLAHDPAMRHLGFQPAAAHAFAGWLLGRHDRQRDSPGVLDAALLGAEPDDVTCARWRRTALQFGLAEPVRRPTPPTPGNERTGQQIA